MQDMNGKGKSKFRDGDPITREDVEYVVKVACDSDFKIVNYHLRTLSAEKLGFLGAHRQLIIEILQENGCTVRTQSYFVKSIPYGIESQVSIIEGCRAFYKEIHFYEKILPELMNSLKDKSWIAQCFLIKKDAMVFEDLKLKNFTLKGKLLDVSDLKAALSAFAKLHASSMLVEKRLGKTFLELYPRVVEENIFSRSSVFRDWFESGVSAASTIAQHLGLDGSTIRQVCDRIFDKISISANRKNVLCHGDPKSYNLMFDDSQKCVLVDFQLVRYAPVSVDILQLLYINTVRDLRNKYELDLLKHYHRELCTILKSRDEKFPLPKYDELLEEFEELRVVGVVTNLLYTPSNMMEGKECAKMTEDSEGFSKLLFSDRSQMILDMMERDSNYRDLIIEGIEEIIERSDQLLKL
ncbi:uncharacterized protein LOC106655469 [Trichogramma pretiosum]|uniref:uncharacterized protein LOC106655469 n=1 Tax=Trichogramma pretiosum TaxID=7493 RepID=UPI0006C9C8FC|nr:uncharacterized protein LOC106655469 [Trichogramma pretiosum]